MSPTSERRGSGTLRVPFVRLCALRFDDGRQASAFIVNINVLGAYIAWEDKVAVGQSVTIRFGTPGNAIEVMSQGAVAWVNPKQQHPVHSLPAGLGLKFLDLPDETRRRVERIVDEYVARRPQQGR